MANVFSIPRFIISGEGALSASADHLKSLGTRALIVTDKAMVDLGNVKKLTDVLDANSISYFVYDEVNAEPTHSMVDKGVELYASEKCNFLIAIGGGSPLDAMKAISAVSANGGSICDYLGKKLVNSLPGMCAIPTTAGTGSEATKICIITNTNTDVKMPLNDPKIMVDVAILESEFTLTSPPHVTAATGVDALTHAIEAYTSKKAFPLSDLYAISSVKRIFANLYEAYTNGSNVTARNEMALAAFEGGAAFTNSSVTIVHGMSRPIGALFHVPHGMSNAMLLSVCLEFLKPAVTSRLCELAKAVGVYKAGMSEEAGADAFVAATLDLISKLNISTLIDYNVKKEDFFKYIPKMSEDAIASGSPGNTVRTPTKEDLMVLYEKLWNDGEVIYANKQK